MKNVVKDLTEHTQQIQQFCLHELPNLYFKLGKDVGLKFTQTELDKQAEILKAAQQEGTDTIQKLSERLGS